MAMEYVDGETLAELVARRGPLPPDEAAELGIQACRGLAAVHAAGLVHRDVKPQNLLLRRDGVLKLGDFGIAFGLEGTRLTMAGTVLGTAAYLAPEQARGEEVTAAADVYGIGAVMYELLTGRPPRAPSSIAELAATATIEPPAGAPPALTAVVMRCLDPAPQRRPPSAAAVAQELAATLPEAPTLALPEHPSQRATEIMARPRPGSRRRVRPAVALAAIAVGAIVGGVGAAIATSGGGSKPPPPTVTRVRARAPRRDGGAAGAEPCGLADALLAVDELDELDGGRGRLCRLLAVEVDALAGKRELHVFAGLVDPPLDGGERDLERVGDLGVREPDDVAEQQRHLEVDVEVRDGAPDRVDRLEPFERLVEHLERRHVLDVDDGARAPLERAQLVEHAVLRHLEEPGRELRAEREAREALVDAEEDFLRQILGERPVPDEPQDVVVDRHLVGAHDDREGAFITTLCLPQDPEVRLWQRQVTS